jgi:hypothetical protein
MRRIPTLLFVLVLLPPSGAFAQQADTPKWDFSVTTGLFVGQPESDEPSYYGDSWYHSARVGLSLGRYWTPHLKTELELMTSGEGMRYSQRTVALPDGTTWPYGVQEYFRVSQASARGVWQLLDNTWVHPYLVAGMSLDADRQHAIIAEQYRYTGDGRSPGSRQLLVPQQTEGPDTVYRLGAMVGAGAKLYLSPNMFANTAVLVTHAKSAQAVSLILGFGLDF